MDLEAAEVVPQEGLEVVAALPAVSEVAAVAPLEVLEVAAVRPGGSEVPPGVTWVPPGVLLPEVAEVQPEVIVVESEALELLLSSVEDLGTWEGSEVPLVETWVSLVAVLVSTVTVWGEVSSITTRR